GFENNVAVQVPDFVLVMRSFTNARDENFPNARRSERAHLLATPIPVVEVTHDADALRVGCPNGEAGARDAIDRAELRPELIINSALIAFAEQIEVGLAQSRQEGVRITRATALARMVRNDKIIGIHATRFSRGTFEHIGLGDMLEFDRGLVLFMHR